MTRPRAIRSVSAFLTLVFVSISDVRAETTPKAPKNVAVIVHDGVELLDFAGPAEVFSVAHDFNVYTVATTVKPVDTQQSVTVVPRYSIDDCPRPDVIVVPGGNTKRLMGDERMMSWIRASHQKSEVTMSVCTGAFALAKLGLLDGLEVTTHHGFVDNLGRTVPTAKVRNDVRFCDSGHIVTAAGISAGIDGALHVVHRLSGEEKAWETARTMQYEWEPAAAANMTEDQKQRREALRHFVYARKQEAADAYQKLVAAHPDDAELVMKLAISQRMLGQDAAAMSNLQRAIELNPQQPGAHEVLARLQLGKNQYAQAAKNYERAVALGERGAVTYYNLACCYARLGEKERAIGALTMSIDAGYWDREATLKDEDLASIRDDPRFAELVARIGKSR